MKTEIIDECDKEPYIHWGERQLLISGAQIILATGAHNSTLFEGVRVYGVGDSIIGYYTDTWSKSLFKPFNGTIKLSND